MSETGMDNKSKCVIF